MGVSVNGVPVYENPGHLKDWAHCGPEMFEQNAN